MIPLEDKMAAVSRSIHTLRWARCLPKDHQMRRCYEALVEIARELSMKREPTEDKVRDVAERLNLHIARARAEKFPDGHFIRLGQELVGCWPTIQYALKNLKPSESADVPDDREQHNGSLIDR